MDVRAILETKRDGGRLSAEQCRAFLGELVKEYPNPADAPVKDYHAVALLAGIFYRGMEPDELVDWTRAMLETGSVLRFPDVDRPKVDKHSTGGVGDKVSLPLAPAVAACGAAVPMISGRGLGHTAGTLDKLEAIPGFTTELDEERLHEVLRACGLVFGAQTRRLVPADKKLYALRDATALVESLPLIASSIMSKKLAEGLDGLVLDVKFGSGAFLREPERGRELAETMLGIASEFGLPAVAWQTTMERPLGRAVGHALEVRESLEVLGGGGPEDLVTLVRTLGGEMLVLAGIEEDTATAAERIDAVLADGAGRELFARAVECQGGDPRCVEDPARLEVAPDVAELAAWDEGHLAVTDCRAIGLALVDLGGGRQAVEDEIDRGVGIVFEKPAGERVERGEPIARLHHRGGRGLDEALERLRGALAIGEPGEPEPLLLQRLTGPGAAGAKER